MAKNKSKSENKNKPESKEKRKMAEDKADAPISKKKQAEAMEIDGAGPDQLRVLERKLKKERKKEEKKQNKEKESVGAPKEQPKAVTSSLSLQYLESFNKKQPGWKFQKARQTWLLTNMYDLQKVSNNHFKMLLKYLEGLKGSARQTTVKKAGEFMKEYEKRDKRDESDERRMNRMREVLQLLS